MPSVEPPADPGTADDNYDRRRRHVALYGGAVLLALLLVIVLQWAM